MLVRGTNYYPPLRGTLLTLDEHEHLLYTHGSIPFTRPIQAIMCPGLLPCGLVKSNDQ
jgi:hypothetical protein